MSVLPKGIGFTQIPNYIFDQHMSELRGSEIKVVLVICRKTFGYQKTFDPIALSQFMTHAGLEKKTVIDAIRSLEKKKIIIKKTHTTPYHYGLNISNSIHTNLQQHKNFNNYNGSKITPRGVQKINSSKVQKMNPQKKASKENKRNTTSSSDMPVEVILVAEYWKEVFNKPIDLSDVYIIDQIKKCLNQFSMEEIKKAIINRSRASYYQEKKPFLIDKPSAFFSWPETVANDLQRKPEGIYTYKEMTDKVAGKPGMTTDHFERIPEMTDEEGQALWKLRN